MRRRRIGSPGGSIERLGQRIGIHRDTRRCPQLREIQHCAEHRCTQRRLRRAQLLHVGTIGRRDGQLELKAAIDPSPVDDRHIERAQ